MYCEGQTDNRPRQNCGCSTAMSDIDIDYYMAEMTEGSLPEESVLGSKDIDVHKVTVVPVEEIEVTDRV